MLMENGLLDVHVPEGVSRGHEKGSDETGIDEKSEWAQVRRTLLSFFQSPFKKAVDTIGNYSK